MQEFVINNEKGFIDKGEKPLAPDYSLLPRTKTLLAKLNDFRRGDQATAIITGPIGSGKSTLIKSFQLENQAICYLIQAGSKINIFSLLAERLLNLDSSAPLANDFDSLLHIMRNVYQEFVLIIDDAEALSLENFNTMVLAFNRQSVAKLKLIIVGETILNKRIDTLLERNNIASSCALLSLEPLSFKEMKHYLKQSLLQTSPKKIKPLSKKTLKNIFQLSEGYPGRINRIALHFTSKGSLHQRPLIKKRRSVVDVMLGIGIICLLAILTFKISTLVMSGEGLNTIANLAGIQNSKAAVNGENLPSYIASIENLPEEQLTPPDESAGLILPEPQR
ncbi:MAG: ATP-binding protein [Gammaproteobacteria bacterium]|nr:ATP-binding protein [Gammaproteobacteria bacterium]